MKSNVLRNAPTHSTAIEKYRRTKANKSSKVTNELPAEIKTRDIGWSKTLLGGGFATISIGIFFVLLLFTALVYGPKF
ncbi:hypothetical protein [Lysinibacillus sp. K60]|uniref:hypothetical protein n=1 Tax=Lysinibacillus sp. K60 TaxID=2720027 RepID=UPI001C8B3000|nr:hypothetical protein [Lysinibacillus sp. K60]MBX8946029.1 hypothetical protein [Lysinibacillus sp. K60]